MPILLRDRVRPAVEWSVPTASANAGFEELPLRAGSFEPLRCHGVDPAIVVVGRLEANDQVPLRLVIAKTRNVTALFDVLTREGVKRNGAMIFDFDGFRRGDRANQGERGKDDESQANLQIGYSVLAAYRYFFSWQEAEMHQFGKGFADPALTEGALGHQTRHLTGACRFVYLAP
jgi:hypothetical protein